MSYLKIWSLALIIMISYNSAFSQNDKGNLVKAKALIESLPTKDVSAAKKCVSDKQYTQHNLAVPDGKKVFEGFVSQGLVKKVNIVRAFQDGDYVVLHSDYDFFGPKVGFDVFRFENGQAVEHWDNLTEKSDKPNPSGRIQLDGPTKVEDLDKTEANKELVADFVKTILMEGKYDQAPRFFDGDKYLQHNTQVPDGFSGLGASLQAMAEKGIYMVYEKNHKILGQGNFVLAMSEGTFGGKPTAFYDLFRVEKGKVVEHWDVMEEIPAKETWKNNNGKF